MHNNIVWIGLIAFLIISDSNAVPLSDFIAFGRSYGDSSFSRIHRTASFNISISPKLPYFNETYSGIFVSSHGYVSFSGRTAFIRPVNFPFEHDLLSVICPFWGNVDQSVSGTTYYRSISSSSQIDEEIRKYFSYANDFTTKWALIATWEKVGYYYRHADKVNTFQVVVATNGSQSYAIFNYLDNGIQWSSADNTGGVNGIGPFGVQVGFNGGDGVHFFVRPEPRSDSILELDDNSNVCVPGKYIFRIDGETVRPGRCLNIKPGKTTCSGNSTIDVVFVIDASGSINTANFALIKEFTANFTTELINDSPESRVGVILFATNAQIAFNLQAHIGLNALLSAINGLTHSRGGTNTAEALRLLKSSAQDGRLRLRNSSKKIAIVITDGKSNDRSATSQAAAELHSSNIFDVYAVGIVGADKTELETIASNNKSDFFTNSDGLQQLKDTILRQICSDMCSKDIGKATTPILMVSNRSSLISINLDTNAINQYGVECYFVYGIGFDLVNRIIYWSEIVLGIIRRVSFDSHLNGATVETIVSGLSRPEQVAVDWINRKLYWTDHGRGVIERSDLDGRNIEVVVDNEIIPQTIVIDPFHKTIYWVNYYTTPRKIERLSANGRIKHTILNVARPSGLTIDYDNNLLYWTDDQFNQLYSSDLAGNYIKVVPVTYVITEPYAIAVFQSNLYWTDQLYSYINIANQFTGLSQGKIFASLNRPTGIHVIHYSRQPGILKPFIIEDTFIHCITVLAPESFTIFVEFVAICMDTSITWELNGNQIVDGVNVKISNDNLGNSWYKTSLTVLKSSESDSGTYTVTITSATGSDSVAITVQIISFCTSPTIQDAYLLYTDYNSINRINLDGSNQKIIISNLFNIHGLDFDILTNMVYWCEVDEGRIYRASINCKGKELIVSGLIHPEEVAIDWINRKLYWCDFDHDVIEYSNLDGTNRRLLVSANLDQPRGLVIDPFFGHIYWTDRGESPKIEKMTLSGELRHTIVAFNNLSSPNFLTIDYITCQLYWVDSYYDNIQTSDLEGLGRKTLFRSPIPLGITVFNGILYWTDWTYDSIVTASISDNTTKNLTSDLLRPSNIHVVHYSMQPGSWYPYIIKGTFIKNVTVQAPESFVLSVEFISCCENFTVSWIFNENYVNSADKYIISTTIVSQCHYKTSLTVVQSVGSDSGDYTVTVTSLTGSDIATISVKIISQCPLPALQDAYLLFTDYNSIKKIDLDGYNQRTIVSNVFNIHGMDVDILTNMVYWCEVDTGNIYRANIDNDSYGRELIVSGLVHPEEVAIDWINRKLYWCDFGADTIEYSTLVGLDRRLLLNRNVDQPRGLAIDPFSGHVYWTDWGAAPKIEKMTLDGTNRQVIVRSNLGWPNGLTIDYAASKLYWVDAQLDRVEVSDLDGNGRRLLYSSVLVPHPFGIAVYSNRLYLTDWSYRTVAIGSIRGGAFLSNIALGIRPSNIHVVHPTAQPGACGASCSCLQNGTYIFFSNDTSIMRARIDTRPTQITNANSHPLAIDIDIITCRVFWSTGSEDETERKGEIRAISLIDSSRVTIHSSLGYPTQIAVNWITRKLYWSDTTLLTIEYSDLDGTNRRTLLSNANIKAIALDPRVNEIYWISKEHDFTISKMKLDGTDKRVIVSSSLQLPNSLSIDFGTNRLFWIDGSAIAIKASDLEGRNVSTVYTYTTQQPSPTGLSVYNNRLFWIEDFEKIAVLSTNGVAIEYDIIIDKLKTRAAVRVVISPAQLPRLCYNTQNSQGAE